jgi:hypothetical protein
MAMTEYITEFMHWLDTSGPLVRAPFVVGLCLLYVLIYRFLKKIVTSLSNKITTEKRFSLSIQSQVIVSKTDMSKIIVWVIRAIGLIIAILIGFSMLNMAMGLFETSRSLAGELLELTLESVGFVMQQVIDYIPSLLVIIVVLVIVRFILHVLKLVFKGIAKGRISIPGFYSEWSATSFNLLRMLIYALTLIIIFPYLPGSDSPAFQGLSLFMGLLLSLGSTTAVANVVAGNATTRDAVGMPHIHSSMNANIMNAFNEAGLEIMSPMFMATRDGSDLTIPPEEALPSSS